MTLSLDLLLKERDLGTPPADRKTRGEAPGTVEVVIDGLTVAVPDRKSTRLNSSH